MNRPLKMNPMNEKHMYVFSNQYIATIEWE